MERTVNSGRVSALRTRDMISLRDSGTSFDLDDDRWRTHLRDPLRVVDLEQREQLLPLTVRRQLAELRDVLTYKELDGRDDEPMMINREFGEDFIPSLQVSVTNQKPCLRVDIRQNLLDLRRVLRIGACNRDFKHVFAQVEITTPRVFITSRPSVATVRAQNQDLACTIRKAELKLRTHKILSNRSKLSLGLGLVEQVGDD